MDRLSAFLKQDDGILFTCGYSFNDEHINEKIISALKTNTTSHVIALIYDKYKNENKETKYSLQEDCPITKIAKSNPKISVYGFRDAIVGRKQGKWKLRKEPAKDATPVLNLYFDEDAPTTDTQEVGEVKPETKLWAGTGEFTLADFARFVQFLNSLIVKDEVSAWSASEKQ